MRILVGAALLFTASFQAGAQTGVKVNAEEKPSLVQSGIMAVSSCAMSQQGGEAILTATLVTSAGPGGGPHVKRQAGDDVAVDNSVHDNGGADFSWGQTNSGSAGSMSGAGRIVPTVIAHAIKTKNAGSNDRPGRQVCDAPPVGQRLLLPAVQKREARPVATCDASGDPAMPTFVIHVPLSTFGQDASRGHVSIIKRNGGGSSGGERVSPVDDVSWTIVAPCPSNEKGSASYDLAIGKKA